MAQPSWAIQGKLNESRIYKYVGRTPKQVTGLVLVTLLGLKVGREESIRDQNSQDAFCCCCSAAQSCPTLCKPTDYSMPGFPSITISRSLLKLMFTELVMPPNRLILCHPLLLLPSIFPASGSFLMSRLFASSGQSIGTSASASATSLLFSHVQLFVTP